MATNNDRHLPIQPNDFRDEQPILGTNSYGTNLDFTLDNHVIVETGWNGYPLYTPNTDGSYDGNPPVAYITVPSVLGETTARAVDLLKDAGYTSANITTNSAATNSAATITATSRTSGNADATVTSSGAGAAFPVGTKITIAGLVSPDTSLNGTWTVKSSTTNTVTFTSGATTALSSTGLSVAGLTGATGTIKTQSVAGGAADIALGTTIAITPWA
jgi:hypothetical protein